MTTINLIHQLIALGNTLSIKYNIDEFEVEYPKTLRVFHKEYAPHIVFNHENFDANVKKLQELTSVYGELTYRDAWFSYDEMALDAEESGRNSKWITTRVKGKIAYSEALKRDLTHSELTDYQWYERVVRLKLGKDSLANYLVPFIQGVLYLNEHGVDDYVMDTLKLDEDVAFVKAMKRLGLTITSHKEWKVKQETANNKIDAYIAKTKKRAQRIQTVAKIKCPDPGVIVDGYHQSKGDLPNKQAFEQWVSQFDIGNEQESVYKFLVCCYESYINQEISALSFGTNMKDWAKETLIKMGQIKKPVVKPVLKRR